MKKALTIFFALTILSAASCSNDENYSDTVVTVLAKKVVSVEPRIVVNEELDTLFASMIDSAKKYFMSTQAKTHKEVMWAWKDHTTYKRDSLGNRLIIVWYNLLRRDRGQNIGEIGTCIVKVKQVDCDTIITQFVPRTDGSFKKEVNNLEKSEFVIYIEDFIFSHSKVKEKLISNFIKAFDENIFSTKFDRFILATVD